MRTALINLHSERLHFAPPSMIENDDLPRPEPAAGQLPTPVKAAGVGRWDALVREGKSGIQETLPLPLIPELSGIVDRVGPSGRFGSHALNTKQFNTIV
jgi:NADPH:quinone reductase-like Zn-dependent oxidoreductase